MHAYGQRMRPTSIFNFGNQEISPRPTPPCCKKGGGGSFATPASLVVDLPPNCVALSTNAMRSTYFACIAVLFRPMAFSQADLMQNGVALSTNAVRPTYFACKALFFRPMAFSQTDLMPNCTALLTVAVILILFGC